LVLLCDALNEMQRYANGHDLIPEVRNYLRDKSPWLVSCRVRDYQEELKDLPDVGKVRLKPLDLPRIKEVIDRRFKDDPERATALWADMRGSGDLLEAWRAFEEANKTENFWEREWPSDVEGIYSNAWSAWHYGVHQDNRRMLRLCRNPFMLFMVCGIFERAGQLPSNRGALFANFVDNLLKREEQSSRATGRTWIEAKRIRYALSQLAYAMQKSDTGTEITRAEAETILQPLAAECDPALLLRLASAASLLEVGDQMRYTHQLLQEYFASEVMGTAMDEKRSATEFWPVDNWWELQGWEETAIILAGVRGDPEAVARWIAPAQPEIAYRALTESGVQVDIMQIASETRAAIVNGAQAKKDEPNPIGRAAAYRMLGLFEADTRPGIGFRPDGLPDIDWVEIPAGDFIFGNQDEKNGPIELTLPTFHIARYPITYRQFQAFLDAPDGFERDEWWHGLTKEYQKQATNDQWFKFWNHPRENVSWYQAIAFCRWLSAKLGYEVRLPTEQEWEKAARSTDGREFPYGNEFDANKGNTSETDINQTSAVGMYPRGASPYGILDMSGNVFEWCLNEYYNPENIALSGDATRVLRGGSWDDYERLARCANRDWYPPDRWSLSRGFRVVCSVPMP
jgi:hypothetical protein